MPTSSVPEYWITTLLFLGVPGAFGGILAVLYKFALRCEEPDAADQSVAAAATISKKKCSAFGSLLTGALAGIGAAYAGMYILVLDGKLDSAPTERMKLMLVSFGVITGFISFKLLDTVASAALSQIKKQLKEVEEKKADAIQVKQQFDKVRTQMDQMSDLNDACNFAENALSHGRATDYPSSVVRLERALTHLPGNRLANIMLGRIYESMGQLGKAVEVLNRGIEAREQAPSPRPQGFDVDTAALYFNRACYEARQGLTAQAIEDLKRAIALDPSNASEARTDHDLDSIRHEPEYVTLLPPIQNPAPNKPPAG